MAFFAEVKSDNTVGDVIVVADEVIGGEGDQETLGQEFIASLGIEGRWLQGFSGGGVRFNYPARSFTYDADRDAFIPPQPFPSWVLDEDTCLWVAPIAYPAEGAHTWDEQAGDWVEVTDENS